MREDSGSDPEAIAWQALRADDRLELSDLTLSIVRGTVYLSGSVPTVVCKRLAEKIVRGVPGVQRVVSAVHIAPAGYRRDDELKQAVEAAMAREPGLAEARVSVTVEGGIVTLHGEVDQVSRCVAAEHAAWSVGGVQAVCNRIVVVGSSLLSEEEAAHLQQELQTYLGLDPSRITVTVSGDRLVLSGDVPSAEHRLVAEDILRWYNPALDIENRLTVT